MIDRVSRIGERLTSPILLNYFKEKILEDWIIKRKMKINIELQIALI